MRERESCFDIDTTTSTLCIRSKTLDTYLPENYNTRNVLKLESIKFVTIVLHENETVSKFT